MPTSVNALSSIIQVFRKGDGTYFNQITYGTRRTFLVYRQPYRSLNVQRSSEKNEKILALLPDGLGEHIIFNTNTKAEERYKYSYWRTSNIMERYFGVWKMIFRCYLYVCRENCSAILWWFTVLNATFNNISVLSWKWVSLVEETGEPSENHLPVASHWDTLSHTVVSSTPRHERGSNS